MFFALAMLFCLGNIQGNPVDKPSQTVEYVSDQSPPVFVFITGSEVATMNQLERGASVQILELNQAQSVNERVISPVLYTNYNHQNRLHSSDLGLRYTSSRVNPIETKAYIATVNNFRAREKV
jgi:hypothetical protein